MVICGGDDGARTNTGGRYDPLSDTWLTTTTTFAPGARWQHTAVWSGASMIAWGGQDVSQLGDGGIYVPGLDAWASPLAFAYRAP